MKKVRSFKTLFFLKPHIIFTFYSLFNRIKISNSILKKIIKSWNTNCMIHWLKSKIFRYKKEYDVLVITGTRELYINLISSIDSCSLLLFTMNIEGVIFQKRFKLLLDKPWSLNKCVTERDTVMLKSVKDSNIFLKTLITWIFRKKNSVLRDYCFQHLTSVHSWFIIILCHFAQPRPSEKDIDIKIPISND